MTRMMVVFFNRAKTSIMNVAMLLTTTVIVMSIVTILMTMRMMLMTMRVMMMLMAKITMSPMMVVSMMTMETLRTSLVDSDSARTSLVSRGVAGVLALAHRRAKRRSVVGSCKVLGPVLGLVPVSRSRAPSSTPFSSPSSQTQRLTRRACLAPRVNLHIGVCYPQSRQGGQIGSCRSLPASPVWRSSSRE